MKNAKRKLFNGKKGLNDISIATIFVIFFFASAFMMNEVNSAFATDVSLLDVKGISDDVKQDAQGTASPTGVFGVFVTVMRLAFFDFGDALGLPLWLDLFYTIVATMFILTLSRNIWVGGGA